MQIKAHVTIRFTTLSIAMIVIKIETNVLLSKEKKDRFTQNRSPQLVLCLNLSSVQKFSGFEINELPLIVGFCFSMSLLLLSK